MSKSHSVFLSVLRTVLPLFFIFSIELFFSQWVTLVVILLSFIYSYTFDEYEKREWLLAVVGFALGLIIEVGMGIYARQQYWSETFFLGVPIWLPFIWGYAFIIMRRVGNRILG